TDSYRFGEYSLPKLHQPVREKTSNDTVRDERTAFPSPRVTLPHFPLPLTSSSRAPAPFSRALTWRRHRRHFLLGRSRRSAASEERNKKGVGAVAFVLSQKQSLKLENVLRMGQWRRGIKKRIDYLNTKIYKDDTTCTKMIRLKREPFFRLCQVLRERSLLRDTIHVCVEEQVAMFLNTVGHNLRNRLVGTNFSRSGETVSCYFGLVLHAIGELRNELIRPPSLETPSKIAGNPRWDSYFKYCIGAIDGTHIRASVSQSMEAAFRGRKSFPTQNVMAAEGTAHDAVVLADALERENGMDLEQQGDNLAGHAGGVQWPSAMSSFMLKYLAQLVANGTKTSTGFKQVHYNGCARALKESLNFHVTGIQVANHIRKWKKVYKQIQGLKNISRALWDEDTCTIRLEQQHYLSYVQDHREDAKYVNTPLENYHEMATIFGNSLATDAYAKGSNEPLATEVTETENIIHDLEDGTTTNEKVGAETGGGDDVAMSGNNNGAQSSGTKPPPAKKPKVVPVEDPNLALVTMMSENLGNLATAVVKLVEFYT
ncbi:hypothetical protein EJB05_55791, partial [Eragrostis curvula]